MKKISAFFLFFLIISTINIYSQNCTVNAGIDQTVCKNQQITLDGNSQGLFNTPAKWSQISGASTIIDNPNNLSSNVNGYTEGDYMYRISATCEDGRFVYDDVTYTINPISDANAGIDIESCPGIETLMGNSPGTGETAKWSIESSNNAGISITDILDPNSDITLADNVQGITKVRWTITNATCSSSDEIIITNYGGQTPVSAGPDQNLGNCYTVSQSTSLNASIGGDGAGGQIGTWSLVNGPNYPSFSNIHSNTSTISNLIEGTYTLRWTVNGTCVNGSDDMSITVPAASQEVSNSDAGNNIRFCNGSTSAILSGSYPEFADEIVEWSQSSGPAGATITHPNDPSTSVTGLDGSSSYTFKYKIENTTYGCYDIDYVNIRYSDPATIDITDGDFINTCGDTSVTIHYSVSGGTSTQYRILSGPYTSNWIHAGKTSQTIKFTEYGTFVIQFRRYASGTECGDAYDQITVTVSDSPTASNAGTDQILACNVIETDLAGNDPKDGTGKWTQISGPNNAIIADPYDKSSHISGLIEGEYFFRWTISAGLSCPNTQDEVKVVVSTPTTSTTAAGADQNVCGSSIIYLDAQSPAENETGSWSVTPSSGIIFSNINDPKASVTGIAPSTSYEFIWHVESACAWAEDTALVVSNSVTGPSIANAGPNQCQPDGTISIDMAGNNPTEGTGTWTYISGPINPTISDPNSYNSSIDNLVNGTYAFEWAISKTGCQTTRDTVWVTASPAADISNAGSDIELCGTTTSLNANNPTIGSGTWKQISGNAGVIISDPTSPTATLSNLSDGSYWYTWSVSVGVCPETIDTTIIFVSTPPTTANAGADQDVCSSTSTTLDANIPINGNGFWSFSGSSENRPYISSVSNPKSNISSLVTGQYHLFWNIENGPFCPISKDEVVLSVSAPAVAGNDQQLCNSSEVLLTGTEGSSGTWTETSSLGADISAISSYSAIASNLVVEGDYTFRYTVPAIYSCPSTFDEVLIQTSPYGDQPDAGPDQEICTSGGNSTILDASAPGTGTGVWNVISAPNTPSFIDDTDPKTTISGLVAGLYILEWNVSYNWCSNYSDIVRITVYDPPTVANAGADQTTACVLNTQLTATAPTVGIGEWSFVSGPGTITIDNPNLSNTTVSNPSASGTYTLQWTTTNGSVCSASSDQIDITFGSSNPPTTPNAGSDKQICDTTATSLSANTITTGTGSWSQYSGPVSASISNINDPNADITNLNDIGIYKFVWKSTEGFCELTDTISLERDTTVISNAGKDSVFCEYQSVKLNANNPNPGIGTWSFVSGPSTPIFENESIYNSRVAGTVLGNYIFKWTINNGACSNESIVNIDLVEEPLDDLSVSGDTQCYASDANITINNTQNGIEYYVYKSSTLITQATGDGNNIDITIPWDKISVGDNYLTIIADNGSCSKQLINQALVHVDACADLELTKEVDDTVKHVGANIDFLITVTNHGPSDATNTVVSDLIPSGYTYVSDNSGGSYIPATGIWTIGNLLSGNDTSLTITATVNLTGIYTNNASVNSDENDPDPTNNQDSASVEAVPYSDLVIEKTVDNPTPDVGSNVVFTISVTNNGPNDALNVIVKDSLPSGYTYLSDNSGGAYNTSTHIWTIGNLINLASVNLQITASVDTSGDYKNIAFVSGDVIEPDSTNNSDSITPVPIPICDLEVEKTVDIQDAYVGSDVTFTISVTNNGPNNASGVKVLDTLPSGFTYVSDNGNGSYNSSNGIWSIGYLAYQESITLEITATINVIGNFTNSAVVSGDQTDRITTNDSSAVTINPIHSADLELKKTVNVTEEYVNDDIIFTLTVYNNGPSQATNVEVIDLLPSGYTYVSDNSNATYNSNNGVWTIGTLNVNDSIQIQITVKINLAGNYINSASVEADEHDPDESNNSDEASITVIRTVLVPEGFSPNGDGINDNFRIKGIEDYPINKLEIINRWGDRIYIKENYFNEWDGTTSSGKQLPEGVYFYILDLKDGSKSIKGYIYLKR